MIHLLGILFFSSSVGVTYFTKRKKQPEIGQEMVATVPQTDQLSNEPTQAETTIMTSAIIKEAEIDHNLKVSGTGLGLAATGHLFYAPLGLLSLPLLGYSTLVVFRDAYTGLQERKLRIALLDSTAICVGVGSGLYALSAIANVIYFGSAKLLYQTRNKTQKKIADIFSGHSQMVWLITGDTEVSVPLEKICKNDRIVINTGETIPIDGTIEEGIASIDQHILTGESQPEEKMQGDKVFAATLVISGRITVRVEKTGIDTVAAQITNILDKTDDFISTLQTRSEHLANRSVAPTIGFAGLSLLISTPTAMAVILSSNFSEVMRLTVPLSMLNYLHIASQSGVLIKDGRSLELFSEVDTVVFDKTGTLTLDQPHVGTVYPSEGFTDNEVLYYTAVAEYRQSHPIAKAILTAVSDRGLELPVIEDAKYNVGYGICVNLKGKMIRVGSKRFMQRENIRLPDSLEDIERVSHERGCSLIYTALEDQLCGVVELCPTLRPEAQQAVKQLQQRGLKVYILSGDHEGPVRNLAKILGVDEYIAETLPEDKSRVIEELQQSGKTVCFVGDGINDSIALKKAAISVSLQDASHIARDSAQVVLMNKDLLQLLNAFELADRFNKNQKLGIGIAVVAPSLICMGGALFFSFTIANTLVFYCASTIMGVGSTMLPLLQERFMQTATK
jgi:Cu2+-exporting ATPase